MSEHYHEPPGELPQAVRDRHRIYQTIMEEFEAIDWYDQRIAVTADPSVRALLQHNRDEEVEHAMMALEWVLRNDAVAAGHARTYLFSHGPIQDQESGSCPVAGDGTGLLQHGGQDE